MRALPADPHDSEPRPSRGASGAATGDFSDPPPAATVTEQTRVGNITPLAAPREVPEKLGRFRVLERIGAGGMGQVFKGEDTAHGSIVAIKVLASELAHHPESLKRFHKEARLLAELQSPFIANLIEIGEEQGLLYLAIEYVQGCNLTEFMRTSGPLDEPAALEIMCDVVRGLATAHERHIVHRDIKPENILMVAAGGRPPAEQSAAAPRVKLTDFGLARHVVESESLNLTKTGAILGTPLYMAPEQCSGRGTVDERTDVYACGATLYFLLAGRPPFIADTALGLIAMHCNEAPAPIESHNAAVSPGLSQVIQKTLSKNPDARYANANELLHDLERLRRGEPTSILAHPRLPSCDRTRIVEYNWSWQLDAAPEQLWPHVSNTERLNRAVGLQSPSFTSEPGPGGAAKRIAHIRSAGMDITWQEHPFEWIEGRRFGVLREFSKGPFRWYTSVVELEPRPAGGTLLTHRLKIEPSGLLGRTAAAIEIGIRSKGSLDRVYRRIDAAVMGRLGRGSTADPFEPPASLPATRQSRLDRLLAELAARGLDAGVVEALGDFVAHAPDQEVARIRPIALAKRLGLSPELLVAACLHGAREGMLVLLWDILCPICRIPSEVKETLRVVREHGRCAACNLDFELDFANSVEMIFRAHPEIRDVELGVFCIGGPVHSPHVAAQARVAPGETFELGLALGAGHYRIRGPQLPFTVLVRVEESAATSRLDLDLSRAPATSAPVTLRTGTQLIAFTNRCECELVVRLERTATRDDALTAARAATMAIFRQLFPGEVLAPGQLVNVATVTLLVTDLADAARLYDAHGDAAAFAIIHEHFRLLADRIAHEGGAVIKTVHEGLIAAFSNPVAAIRAALALQSCLKSGETTRELELRIGVHRGPAMAATINDHLDYFGRTVRAAMALAGRARGGDLLVSEDTWNDASAGELIADRPCSQESLSVELTGGEPITARRISLAPH
jgi:serine/threonine protein kinase/class 3 adenylate cyclase